MKYGKNFFHQMKPIYRCVMSMIFATGIFLLLPVAFPIMLKLLISWSMFCIVYLIYCWYIVYTMPVNLIKKIADKEDGSRAFVFSFILIVSFATMFAVLSLIVSREQTDVTKKLIIPVAIIAMLASWMLIHTIFLFHYAQLFYKSGKTKGGLSFPGCDEPDYIDFAYFSFVMGCTFQVSDVSITNRRIRQTALFHGLLSFALNTFVVALSINIVAGLAH